MAPRKKPAKSAKSAKSAKAGKKSPAAKAGRKPAKDSRRPPILLEAHRIMSEFLRVKRLKLKQDSQFASFTAAQQDAIQHPVNLSIYAKYYAKAQTPQQVAEKLKETTKSMREVHDQFLASAFCEEKVQQAAEAAMKIPYQDPRECNNTD